MSAVISPALGRFEWPTPHHFNQVDAPATDGAEPGIVRMNDGRKLVGDVVRLDTWASVLEFQIGPGRANLMIEFSAFKSLCLSRIIVLERVPLIVPAAHVAANPVWKKQLCTVQFKDGTDLVSDAVGIVVRKFGLYLFLAKAANQVQRWFIPMQAIASYRNGDLIGKMLIDHEIVAADVIDAGLEKQQRLRSTPLGQYLQRRHIVTAAQLEATLRHKAFVPHMKLGDALVQQHAITERQRDDALATQKTDRRKALGTILVEMGVVTADIIKRMLVEQLGIPLVHLTEFQFDPNAIKAIPADLAHRHTAMPLCRTALRIAVALEDPLDGDVLHALEFSSGLKVDPVLASHDDLVLMIEQFYGPRKVGGDLLDLFAELDRSDAATEVMTGDVVNESDSTLVRLVNKIIGDAVAQGVSDIHIESRPGNKPSRVRFRKDGVLVPYTEIPANFRAAVVSRIKIMCDLDISEKRRPQDGKMSFRQFGPSPVELRVVTMPTANSLEGVVMRILTAPRAISIEKIDLAQRVLADLKALVVKPFGLLFVCGPTGSGKTTTLHALLSYINTPERKIWTVENPIEITQDGLNQVQVNSKIGLTFPEVLRSFMRADPDVIMVGETRDTETAATVITASLTGHLVLSTMHTNSAVESVVRLLDFGLDPFNFADALLGVVGQRLVRRLCLKCRVARSASPAEVDTLAQAYRGDMDIDAAALARRWHIQYGGLDGAIKLYSAAGCVLCDNTGYRGRLGIHEMLVASTAIKTKIQAKAELSEITQIAIAEGMLSMKQDGIEKVLQGHTDLSEVQTACL
jgi:type II secretory ATPase GspE/PulE/Tfp pilus assembly ATPase PilB-like protein